MTNHIVLVLFGLAQCHSILCNAGLREKGKQRLGDEVARKERKQVAEIEKLEIVKLMVVTCS